jgi:hypothetical protein
MSRLGTLASLGVAGDIPLELFNLRALPATVNRPLSMYEKSSATRSDTFLYTVAFGFD